jgi:hypothetical protein
MSDNIKLDSLVSYPIFEYVMPEFLVSLNEKVKEKGVTILKDRLLKLHDRLSDIGPGFLLD